MAGTPLIAIVDDDEAVRAAVDGLIRSLGFIAQSFASAEDFLQSAHVDSTSCLISDVQMPNMSGIDLQRALIAQGRDIPIIFITAFPDETVQAKAMKDGAVSFLKKPFDGQAMIKTIDLALKAVRRGK